ncbi:fungal-specific transcription factor domain-containing protein [Mycena floridula]|nr:fungal-specific transcription factor domain-containing protein [Mycena floridula]
MSDWSWYHVSPAASAPGSPQSTTSDLPALFPSYSKREYLLAQIRQKDAIIESLLKQLHNPYIATPLSIASYRMAMSPSDSNNKNILAWLDRLQSSVRDAGGKGGTKAFKLDGRPGDIEEESEAESDHGAGRLTHAQRYGLVPVDADEESPDAGPAETEEDRLQRSLPDSHVPLGLIANLSLSNNKVTPGKKNDGLAEDVDDDNVGVANATYFMPGPATDLDIRAMLIEQHSPPEILVHGLVTPDDVDRLFEIFYERVNPFISLLDPVLHTPASTFARCPFLFTVVCAISSRYYTEKSEIYPIAMHFAKHSAANALIDGWKSVELCQAYILLSVYAVPARKWEEDRSWLYTGLAIRIATDLNLHQVSGKKPQNEKQEREILNNTRVWMICFNLDRSTATQFGKPSTIKEDYIMRNSQEWYKKSKYNIQYDVHMCAHTALLRIVAKFHEEVFSDPTSPSGLNKQIDFRSVTMMHDTQLIRFKEEWTQRFKDHSENEDRGGGLRVLLLPFLVAYARLVMFSFGFQQAYQRGIQQTDLLFFNKCLESAKTVLKSMLEDLAPSGYMRYAPDGHFVFTTFASAFLLKLLRPEFAGLMPASEETEIFDLIGRLIQTLSSPLISIDDRHTPKLHARFLAGLLSKHRRDGATIGRLHTQPPVAAQIQNNGYQQNLAPSSMQSSIPSQGYNLGNDTNNVVTPIYRPEAHYTGGAGAIQFGNDVELLDLIGNPNMDEEMIAAMQALKNPAFWSNMMMPGFSWSDSGSPGSNGSNVSSPGYHPRGPSPGYPNGASPGYQNGHGTQPDYSDSAYSNGPSSFGMFHAAPVSLH